MREADNLTTVLCRCHEIFGTLTSWNPLGHPRPVMGLLYLLFYLILKRRVSELTIQSAQYFLFLSRNKGPMILHALTAHQILDKVQQRELKKHVATFWNTNICYSVYICIYHT